MMVMGRNSKGRLPGRGRMRARTLKMAGIRLAERSGWADQAREKYLTRVSWANSGKMLGLFLLKNFLHIGMVKWKAAGKWTWVLNARLMNWSLTDRQWKASGGF